MIGRSNVGKSSLINALVGQKIARTSGAPGKTRLANVYRVGVDGGRTFHLIDLPGYGYARASRPAPGTQRSARAGREAASEEFEAIVAAYFERIAGKRHRVSFPGPDQETKSDLVSPTAATLLLVDSRHPGLPADVAAWRWLGERDIVRLVVATKLDKLTRAERQRHLAELARIFEGPVTAVSAASGEGLEELWTQIARLLRPPPPRTAPPPIPSR